MLQNVLDGWCVCTLGRCLLLALVFLPASQGFGGLGGIGGGAIPELKNKLVIKANMFGSGVSYSYSIILLLVHLYFEPYSTNML